MGETRITFTSDDKDMVKSLERMQKEMVKLREEARKAAQETKKGADDAAGGWEATAMAAGKAALAYISIQSALRLVNDELERKNRLDKESLTTQEKISNANQEIITNMGRSSKAQIDAIVNREIPKLSADTRISRAIMAPTFAGALSSSQSDVKMALDASRIAAQAMSHRPDAIPLMGSALADMAHSTGSKNMLANLGAIGVAGENARVSDPLAMAESAPKAAARSMQYGAGPAESLSLWSALTASIVDPDGRLAMTGTQQLSRQLQEFLPDIPSMDKRIAFLQANPKEASRFLEGDKRKKGGWKGANFEEAVEGQIKGMLLNPSTSPLASFYSQNIASFPSAGELPAAGQQFLDNKTIDKMFPIAEGSRAAASFKERFEADSAGGGRRAMIRGLLEDTLDKTGGWKGFGGLFGNSSRMMGFDIATSGWTPELGASARPFGTAQDPARVAEMQLTGRLSELQRGGRADSDPQVALLKEIIAELRKGNDRKQVPLRQE